MNTNPISLNNVEKSSNYNITAKDIVNNYNKSDISISDKIKNMSIKKFTKGFVSNRVLDLYLKYMGITMLTTSTLVPLALIMGTTYFEDAVSYIKDSDQVGGKFLENKIPVLDNDLIGNYLKLSGLTLLNVSPTTLVPLGILMYIYTMYENQQGGYNIDVFTTPSHNQNLQIGGGSDWRLSQMSRGAYNSPGQDPNQFKLFTTTSNYISNNELSNGAANHYKQTLGTIHKPLYLQTPANSPPVGYNIL